MVRLTLALLLLSSLGCGTTYQLGEGPGGINIAHARTEMMRKDATFILASGEKYDGTSEQWRLDKGSPQHVPACGSRFALMAGLNPGSGKRRTA